MYKNAPENQSANLYVCCDMLNVRWAVLLWKIRILRLLKKFTFCNNYYKMIAMPFPMIFQLKKAWHIREDDLMFLRLSAVLTSVICQKWLWLSRWHTKINDVISGTKYSWRLFFPRRRRGGKYGALNYPFVHRIFSWCAKGIVIKMIYG